MIFGIVDSPQAADGDQIDTGMDDNRRENGVAFCIRPGEGKSRREVLQHRHDQLQRGVFSDEAQNMDGGKGENRDNVGYPPGFSVEIAEDQPPEDALLGRRNQNHGTDDHKIASAPAHGGDNGVIVVGKAGNQQPYQPQGQKIAGVVGGKPQNDRLTEVR